MQMMGYQQSTLIDALKPVAYAFHLWAVIVPIAVWFAIRILQFSHRGKCFPPGPPAIPILGNAHLLSHRLYRRSVPTELVRIHH